MAKRRINFMFYRYSATLEVRFYVSGLCKQEKKVWNHLLEQKQLDSITTSQCYSTGLAFFGTTFPSDLSAVMRAVHAWNTFWFKSVLIPKNRSDTLLPITPKHELCAHAARRRRTCMNTQISSESSKTSFRINFSNNMPIKRGRCYFSVTLGLGSQCLNY